MAYFTGTINSIASFKTAIENALSSVGWTLTSGILTRDDLAVRFVTGTNKLDAFMGTARSGSTITNESPYGVGFAMRSSSGTLPIIYPATYHIYAYATEVYIGLNYNTDNYQWLAFGKYADIPAGAGHFLTGPTITFRLENTAMVAPILSLSADTMSTDAQSTSTTAAYNTIRPPFVLNSNSLVRASVGGALRWFSPLPTSIYANRIYQSTEIAATPVFLTPGYHFYTNMLAPITSGCEVTGATIIKIFGRLRYARYTRNDYHAPGASLTYGSETWKLWPMTKRVVGTNKSTMLALAFLEE